MPGAVYKAIFSINNRFLKPVGAVAKDIFLPLADLLHSPREEQFSFLSFPQKRESIGFFGHRIATFSGCLLAQA